MNHYGKMLEEGGSVLAGDFNSNQIWDGKPRIGNHSAVVGFLKSRHIESLYHRQEKVRHGEEKHPTFFLHRNPGRPYHIDYIFASESLSGGALMTLGSPSEWLAISDHIPLVADFFHACGRLSASPILRRLSEEPI